MTFEDLPIYIQRTAQTAELLFQAEFILSKHSSKKNHNKIRQNRRTGQRYVGASRKSETILIETLNRMIEARRKYGLKKPIEGKIWVLMRFHYKNTKKGKPRLDVADLSNLYQGPEDCLQKAGIIVDDKQIESHDGSRRVLGSADNKLEILIMRYDHESC